MDLRDLWPRTARRSAPPSIRYRARGAVREVGKALGLPEDVTGGAVRPGLGLEQRGRRREARREELNLNLDDPRGCG